MSLEMHTRGIVASAWPMREMPSFYRDMYGPAQWIVLIGTDALRGFAANIPAVTDDFGNLVAVERSPEWPA